MAKRHHRLAVTLAVLLCGVALVCIGIYRDEVSIVLRKAVNICLECIGIG
nr:CD1871A family CXXC motif-containing protein [Maliibacterium massiliense]